MGATGMADRPDPLPVRPPEASPGTAAARPPVAGSDPSQEEVTGYAQSPSDLLRTCVLLVAAGPLVLVARWARESAAALDADAVRRLSAWAPALERYLSVASTVLLVAAVAAAWTAPLLTRRPRLVGYLFVAGAAAIVTARGVEALLGGSDADAPGGGTVLPWGLDGTLAIDGLAVGAASFAVLAPFVSRRWRRAGVVVLALSAVLQLATPLATPATVAVGLVLGTAVGSATLLVLGRPVIRPTAGAVAAALAGSGLDAAVVEPAAVDARGSIPWTVVLRDGQRVFAKVMGTENRAADLLFRAYRLLRLKDVGDERPFSSLRRTVEHEALVSLLVRDAGARTPRLRALAPVGRDSWLLSHDLVDGTTLDRLPNPALTQPVGDGIWDQVAILRRTRVAHRDLRRANILLDREGAPWLIDWGFSAVAAPPAVLDADVAQLLVTLSLDAGVEPVVDSAVARLGPDAVAASLPRLQPDSLSGATRQALRQHPELLARLRATVAHRCGVPEPRLADLERVRPRTLLLGAALIVAGYLLVPQLGDVPGMFARIRDADWAWGPAVLAASGLTYAGAAGSLAGAAPARLRALPLLAAQLAASFAGRLAPSGLGGMALMVRYLQRSGLDMAVATSAVGLSTAAGTVVHAVLLIGFGIEAGRSLSSSIRPVESPVLLWGAVALLLLTLAAAAVPAARRRLAGRLVPPLRRSVSGLAAALRSPGKLTLLLGGSAVTTVAYLTCLYACTLAFGGGLGLATVGAVYLAGAAVAAAAPTPGGLGALEAALIAGLVGAGMDHTIAVPAVLLYRLATFWLPVLPGWAAFTWLRRTDHV